ncbi:hypothetical protein [uncultured Alistipes sp.]|uniref:hypothetical protein n=1 Tax=uncultured Alistipes sp. TaxID=538949 RepID=UPI002729836F|nr:hypothetical protein [uncultured Alistipes sp.]
MTHIKNILRNMRKRLCTAVPEFAAVEKNRGQLAGADPAVESPCALLDIRSIDFSQQGDSVQLADVLLTVTLAETGAAADSPYRMVELLERVRTALHLFAADEHTLLLCTGLKKVDAANLRECYELTCRTTFEVDDGTLPATHSVQAIGLDVR